MRLRFRKASIAFASRMVSPVRTVLQAVLVGFVGIAATGVRAQVIINEIVAASSDRQLQRTGSGYPKLGLTPAWYSASYDDSLWREGKGPFGFGTFSNVTFGVNTSLQMQNKYPALYIRKPFEASSLQAASSSPLQLTMRYNDGFIAFLNGNEVARRNMGNAGMFAYRDQTAFNTNSLIAPAETISLGIASDLLVAGTNLLCIQTHNKAVTGAYANNLLCMADLTIASTTPASLVTNTTSWSYFVGTAEPSGGLIDYGILAGLPSTASWATLGFNDASWPESKGPFGFESPSSSDYELGTNLYNQVYNRVSSIYFRELFTATAAEAASTNALQIILDYDDGIVVYLNGREIARRNLGTAGTIVPYDALALSGHNADGDGGGTVTGQAETILLGAADTLLSSGYNILGVQFHNSSKTSSDMIARVTLSTTGPNARTLCKPDDTARFFIGIQEPAETDEDTDSDDTIDDTPDSENDWIELRNKGTNAVNLTGWSLTDDADKPRKWYFPAGSAIPASGYLVVMATGYAVGPADGATYLHTNFKLSKEGEYLGLVNATGEVVNEITPAYPVQDALHAYARNIFGAFIFTDVATPGTANTGNIYYGTRISEPVFSHLGGFYSSSFQLQLTSPANTTIRYTLDGSEPTDSNGSVYSAPLTIDATTVIRARSFKFYSIPSDTVTQTYLISQSAARQSLPALSLVADPTFALYGPNASGGPTNGEGIFAIKGGGYTNSIWNFLGDTSAFNIPNLRGRCSEKPASFEFFPTNGTSYRTDLGLRISGSPWSRPRYKLTISPSLRFSPTDVTQKPSFNLFFRGELGDSTADYPFFSDSAVTRFGDLRIRAGKNDVSNPFIKDELMRRICIGTGQEGSHGIFASVYLNGVWKGYYNLCEHLREAFMQQHHNSTEDWDVRQVGDITSGDAIHWNSMYSYLRSHDLTERTSYEGVSDYLDIDNFIDYLLVNIFGATWDWPNNNWVAARERSDAGRWRFYMWDAEGAFGGNSRNPATYDIFIGDKDGDGVADSTENSYRLDIGSTAQTTTGYFIPSLYTLLKVSPEFRLRFADRAEKHFFHGGCLTQASMTTNFMTLRDQINPIMKETIGAYMNESFYTNWIHTSVRRDETFVQLAQYGFWPDTLAPAFSQHGGEIASGAQISITNPNSTGSIYYTIDGTDPRSPGGAVAGILYSTPVCFFESATLKARVLNTDSEWSPLQEAAFTVPSDIPVFLPTVSADWAIDANWSSDPQPFPNGESVSVQINAPPTGDREIKLRVPVTVGTMIFNQGNTPYRNKISDSGDTNSLTFCTTNQTASLTVNGNGAGYVELEINSDVILDSSFYLIVNNPTGNVNYGALRLKANWRGTGSLVKTGVGRISLTGGSKTYTGATIIRRGVLQCTQPAAPLCTSSVYVYPGGQLRLTSASTADDPRVYGFGGDLTLNSAGWSSGLSDTTGLGIEGGLRYEPESPDSTAVVTNRILVTGASCIHVENARNTLELTHSIEGSGTLTKTGDGTLTLYAAGTNYCQPISVNAGTLTVHGRLVSSVGIAADATLNGTGQVGALDGDGTVSLDGTLLTAASAVGLNYAFSFTALTPSYASSTTSGNAVLRLSALYPGTAVSRLDLYLNASLLAAGNCLRGGFFVEGGNELSTFLTHTAVRFFVADAAGSQTFAGRLYAPYTGSLPLTVTAMPETADFGDGPRQGHVLEIRAAGLPVRFSEWVLNQFTSENDLTNQTVVAPLATPKADNVPNLLRYAFDIGIDESASNKLPAFSIQNGVPIYCFRFDPGKNDLTYRVEAAAALTDAWSRILFDSGNVGDLSDLWDGTLLTLPDEAAGPALVPTQFYRLQLRLDDP